MLLLKLQLSWIFVSLSLRGVFLSPNGGFGEHNFSPLPPVLPSLNNERFLGSSFLKIMFRNVFVRIP